MDGDGSERFRHPGGGSSIGQVPEDPVGLVTVPHPSEPGTRSLIHVGSADAAIGGIA